MHLVSATGAMLAGAMSHILTEHTDKKLNCDSHAVNMHANSIMHESSNEVGLHDNSEIDKHEYLNKSPENQLVI